MSKVKPTELPYFRFFHNDWMGGLISRQPREVQGFFIDLCAIYWKQQCKGDLKKIKAYIPDLDKYLNTCVDLGIVEIKNEKVTIKFLKKQREELIKKSETNSSNGRKGGKAKALKQSETLAKPKRNPSETVAFSESYSDSNTESELSPLQKTITKLEGIGTMKAFDFDKIGRVVGSIPENDLDKFFDICEKAQSDIVNDGLSPYGLGKLVDKARVLYNLKSSKSQPIQSRIPEITPK